MGAKSRILALKLLEKQKKHPEYAKQIGVEVNVTSNKKEESYKKRYNVSRSGFFDWNNIFNSCNLAFLQSHRISIQVDMGRS